MSGHTTSDHIVDALDNVSLDDLDTHPGSRIAVIEAAKRMLARLETPFEQVWQHSMVGATVASATRVVRNLGLFEAWREAGGKQASLEELWVLCKTPCDMVLLQRLLRLCTAANIIEEVDEDRYGSTPTSLALGVRGGPADEVLNAGLYFSPSINSFPEYLAKHGYENPTNPNDTPYMMTSRGHKGAFELFAEDEPWKKSFIGLMAGLGEIRFDWTELYDSNQLINGFNFDDKDKTLIVDVGGADGIDLKRLSHKQPQIPAHHLIVQDLPPVIAAASPDDKVKLMPYDFFTPQPVVGARAYLLHSVLHDWDDIEARRILKQIAGAMKPGYSRLLVCDVSLPPKGATLYQAQVDTSIMHLLAAGERTEARWIWLLRGADFEIIKIWRLAHSPECLIEAELAAGLKEGK